MDETDYYLELLKKQFCEAKGLKRFNDNSKELLKDLKIFIKDRQYIGQKYLEFLNFIKLDVTTSKTAEVNKGKDDTIIKKYDTLAITPYPMDIERERLYNYSFISTQKGPRLILKDNKEQINIIPGMPIQRYMTQNPYSKNDIDKFQYLYNENKYDILVGMYGKIYDNDKYNKLQQLNKLSKKIKDWKYKTAIFSNGSYYYYVLYTDRFEREKYAKMMDRLYPNNKIKKM